MIRKKTRLWRSVCLSVSTVALLLACINLFFVVLPTFIVTKKHSDVVPEKEFAALDWSNNMEQDFVAPKTQSQKVKELLNLDINYGANGTIDELVRAPLVADRKDIYVARNKLVQDVCDRHGLADYDGFSRLLRKMSGVKADQGDLIDAIGGNIDDEDKVTVPEVRWRDGYPVDIDKTLIWNAEKKLTYCWTHKVASTSWNKIFLDFAGRNYDPAHMYRAAVELKPDRKDLVKVLSDKNIRFTYVRHPFERLVSAFVEKFELSHTYNWVYKTYAPDIFAVNNITNPTNRPTFRQFAIYLIHTRPDQYNDHWIPQWIHCRLCQVHYDIIGYLETGFEDGDFIAQQAGLTDIQLPWHNKSQKKHGKDRKHESPLGYFAELDLELLEGLYDKFRIDFEMFNYSAEEYFQIFQERKTYNSDNW